MKQSRAQQGDNAVRDRIDRIQIVVWTLVGLVATIALTVLPSFQDVDSIEWYSAVVGAIAVGCFVACIPLALRRTIARVAIRWIMVTTIIVTIAATSIVVLAYPSSVYGTAILLGFTSVFAGIVFALTFADDRKRRLAKR